MRYGFFPKTMWKLFNGSFKRQLKKELHEPKVGTVMKNAKKRYKEIVESIQEFDKGDRFLFNILSCAFFSFNISNKSLYSIRNYKLL